MSVCVKESLHLCEVKEKKKKTKDLLSGRLIPEQRRRRREEKAAGRIEETHIRARNRFPLQPLQPEQTCLTLPATGRCGRVRILMNFSKPSVSPLLLVFCVTHPSCALRRKRFLCSGIITPHNIILFHSSVRETGGRRCC